MHESKSTHSCARSIDDLTQSCRWTWRLLCFGEDFLIGKVLNFRLRLPWSLFPGFRSIFLALELALALALLGRAFFIVRYLLPTTGRTALLVC